ncbi:MAG: PilZ domain-containing protein, partial [Terracidiphilus sp.]
MLESVKICRDIVLPRRWKPDCHPPMERCTRAMKFLRILGIGANLLSHRRDLRFAADELDVVYCTEARQKRVRIRDISATGLYMLTEDRWVPGTGLPLTVNKWRLQGENPQAALRLKASVVRHGKDGVGFEFSNGDSNAAAWSCLARMPSPIALRDALSMLRFTRAIAFLYRLSPSHEAETLELIQNQLAFESSEAAVDTLLVAEELATRRGFESRPEVSLEVIRRILHEGSRTSEAWVRRFWSGLLAASVPQGGDDFKTLAQADLLSMLDSVQVRIVAASCARAGYKWDNTGVITPQPFFCTAEELKRISHVADLAQIEHCLDHLHRLGLLEKTVKADPFDPIGEANLTPTRTGLALYAECNGWPEWSRAAELLTHI